MRTVVVLAGGLGTRVSGVTRGRLPKALIPIDGEPFLHHKLTELLRLGADRAVLLLGHGSEQIIGFIREGQRWNLDIEIIEDGPRLLGTGGSIKSATGALPDQFWVTYGDTLLDVDLEAAEGQATERGFSGVMTVLHNCDRWEPSNVRVSEGVVAEYSKTRTPVGAEHIDYGYIYLDRTSVDRVPGSSFDLEDVLQPMIAARTLGAFEARVPFHDIGTPEAIIATERWLQAQR